MKILSLLFIGIVITVGHIDAQTCSVELETLKGTYNGSCKNGKASGKGFAEGIDSYQGSFAAGLPNGQGTYKWKNGNEYTGWFVKGAKDGMGKMLIKRINQTDSTLEGLWKKDVYVGQPKQPYRVVFQSKAITEVDAEKKNDGLNKLTFFVITTSGTARTLEGDEYPKMKVDDIQILSGTMGRLYYNNESTGKRTESVVENVEYPARMRVMIGTEELEIEFMQPGSYIISVRIND